jgi:hypothetical protein
MEQSCGLDLTAGVAVTPAGRRKGLPNEVDVPEALRNCYTRTLRIEDENGFVSSSFVFSHGGFEWLVTAWHVVHDRDTKKRRDFDVIDQHGVKHSGSELDMLDATNTSADVAVFHLWSKNANFGDSLEAYDQMPSTTQQVYFLGFPDLANPLKHGLKYASPTKPFIKQAMVSGEARHRNGITTKIWLLDGMAHHGFSGGPVLIYEPKDDCYRVLGIVTGYVPSYVRVSPGEVPADFMQIGHDDRPLPDDPFALTNSGIAICFDISHAIAYINDEPSDDG